MMAVLKTNWVINLFRKCYVLDDLWCIQIIFPSVIVKSSGFHSKHYKYYISLFIKFCNTYWTSTDDQYSSQYLFAPPLVYLDFK